MGAKKTKTKFEKTEVAPTQQKKIISRLFYLRHLMVVVDTFDKNKITKNKLLHFFVDLIFHQFAKRIEVEISFSESFVFKNFSTLAQMKVMAAET